MEPLADIRIFCAGRCGMAIHIPAKVAVKMITVEGEIREDAPAYICPKCRAWFNRETCRLLIGGQHEKT